MHKTVAQSKDVPRAGRASGNLGEEAYVRMKAFILTSRILPGDRLLHRVLAQGLGMSSTPIREAMGRLVQEGYIRHIPNVGYSVPEMDAEEAEQLFEAREALETHAVALAAAHIQPADLRLLARVALAFRRAIRRRPRKARVLLDMEFHLTIVRLSRNRFLLQALEPLLHQIAAKRNVENFPPQAGGLQADQAHQRILDALQQRAPELARRAMRDHLRQSKVHIVRQLKERRLSTQAKPPSSRMTRLGWPAGQRVSAIVGLR